MGKKFYFVRHGMTDWHRGMVPLGPQDLSLNETGRAEIQEIRNILIDKDIRHIYTSPAKRCLESAHIIKEFFPHLKIEVVQELNERYLGDWSTCKEQANRLIKEASDDLSFNKSIEEDEIEYIAPADAEDKDSFENRAYNAVLEYGIKKQHALLVAHGCVKTAFDRKIDVLSDTQTLKYGHLFKYKQKNDQWSSISMLINLQILFVRHGETNRPFDSSRQIFENLTLNENGINQVKAITEKSPVKILIVFILVIYNVQNKLLK